MTWSNYGVTLPGRYMRIVDRFSDVMCASILNLIGRQFVIRKPVYKQQLEKNK